MRSASKKLPIWKLVRPPEAALLRQVATPVSVEQLLKPETQALIDAMIPSMYAARGIGLAAPQVGQSLRIAIIGQDVTEGLGDIVIVNPVITPIGTVAHNFEEGCLSVPKVYGMVSRSQRLKLQALNRAGVPFELVTDHMFARVIQHEVDHLNGKLFIDRVSEYTHGRPRV